MRIVPPSTMVGTPSAHSAVLPPWLVHRLRRVLPVLPWLRSTTRRRVLPVLPKNREQRGEECSLFSLFSTWTTRRRVLPLSLFLWENHEAKRPLPAPIMWNKVDNVLPFLPFLHLLISSRSPRYPLFLPKNGEKGE